MAKSDLRPHAGAYTRAIAPVKKCRPPVGLRTRFCVALEAVLAPESNQGKASVYVVHLLNFKTSDIWVAGVAARRSAKNKPVFFNCCPFCGADVAYFKKAVYRKVAR